MQENKPFFSVVIPLYNKQRHIKKTIDSAFAQTFQDFEIVVVDDGSTDDSANVVKAIEDSRIRLVQQENGGVSVARNQGIRESQSDYIVFLDADDLWMPHFLQTIYNLIESYPDAGIYATSYMLDDGLGNVTPKKIKGLPSKDFSGIVPNYFSATAQSNFGLVWTSATCIPKKIFFENDIWFPESVTFFEDVYVWGRIALVKDVVYCSRECAIYVLDSDNSTRSFSRKNIKPSEILLSLKSYENISSNASLKKGLEKYLDRHIISCIIRSKRMGDTWTAISNVFLYRISLSNRIYAAAIAFMPFYLYRVLRTVRRKAILLITS